MTSSNDQCIACMEPLSKQIVNLLVCKHNCLCKDCVLTYFENDHNCPICRTKINKKILINGWEIYLRDIYHRSRSNTCPFLFATITIEQHVEDVRNGSPSIDTFCSFCECEIDLNWALHHRCGCDINKSVACAECLENNPEFTFDDICDFRCL